MHRRCELASDCNRACMKFSGMSVAKWSRLPSSIMLRGFAAAVAHSRLSFMQTSAHAEVKPLRKRLKITSCDMPADTSDVPPLHSVALLTLGSKLSGSGIKIRNNTARSRFNARRRNSSIAGYSRSPSAMSTRCAPSGYSHRKV